MKAPSGNGISKAPAITRAAAILRLLSESETALGVQSIARQLDLVPSTCLHVLRALTAENLVSFDSSSKLYSPGVGILVLAQKWLRKNRFIGLVQPVLDALSREFTVTMVGLRIVDQEQSVVVAVSQWDPNLQLATQVGSSFPAYAGATGLCLAAFEEHSAEELRERFATLEWSNPPKFDDWMRNVERARQTGVAVDAGNYISGVTVVLAPVWEGPGQLNHALIAFGISDALRKEKLETLKSRTRDEAEKLSKQLSGNH